MLNKRQITETIHPPLILTPLLFFCAFTANASSVYVGHSSSEQVSILGERNIDLNPSGQSIYLSLDINENWSISGDYTHLEDSSNVENLANLRFDIDTFSSGVSYFGEQWSLYYQFSSFDDEQVVTRNGDSRPVSTETTEVSTHSFGGGYYWTLQENWQVSLTASVHLSDWDQRLQTNLPDPNRPPQSSLDSGDSTLVSVSGNLARFIALNETTSLTLGSFVSWNEAIDSSSETVNRNGRNVSQIRNPEIRSQINSQIATGSESYGQLSFYLSLDFMENWVLDLDTSFDFGTDENTQSWSINLGYFF